MLFGSMFGWKYKQIQSALLRSDYMGYISDHLANIGIACDCISIYDAVKIEIISFFNTAGYIDTLVHFYDTVLAIHGVPVMSYQ